MSPSPRDIERYSTDQLELWGKMVSTRIDELKETIELLREQNTEMAGKIIRLETKLAFVSALFGLVAGLIPTVISKLWGGAK